jgi:hypothetical protein
VGADPARCIGGGGRGLGMRWRWQCHGRVHFVCFGEREGGQSCGPSGLDRAREIWILVGAS